ncbi:uncharacterized protein LOC141855931 [Brevipalpus obovatus]|uniref:uncharacterized protein LOC141855931 n=1 Tax=Brevipalpus obovatus TaxID=246614 RepID=UPI003D9F32E8
MSPTRSPTTSQSDGISDHNGRSDGGDGSDKQGNDCAVHINQPTLIDVVLVFESEKGCAKGLEGQYNIKKILGHGPVIDRLTGKIDILHLFGQVEWEDSLLPTEDLISNLDSPLGFPCDVKSLSQTHDPADKTDPEEMFTCRVNCGRNYYTEASCKRHEKVCTYPGGPKHECPEMCISDDCIGRRDYFPRPDRRFGNTKGKRGPKPKKRRNTEMPK